MKKKIQLIEKEIPNSGDVVKISEELDRNYKHLTGISFPENIGNRCILNSSSVDGDELFPKNFEVVNMQSSKAVSPDERYLTVKEKADGNKIEMEFKDGAAASNYPYVLKIQLRLEND